MTVAFAAALAIAPAACGGKSNEQQVRETLDTFYGAVENKDGRTACNLLTRAERARVTTPSTASCGQLTLKAAEKTGVTRVPEVSEVDVSGQAATATVRTGGRTHRVQLDKELGRLWRISRL